MPRSTVLSHLNQWFASTLALSSFVKSYSKTNKQTKLSFLESLGTRYHVASHLQHSYKAGYLGEVILPNMKCKERVQKQTK